MTGREPGRELLQGNWCMTGRDRELAGGCLDPGCIHYTTYFGKYVENCMQSLKMTVPAMIHKRNRLGHTDPGIFSEVMFTHNL